MRPVDSMLGPKEQGRGGPSCPSRGFCPDLCTLKEPNTYLGSLGSWLWERDRADSSSLCDETGSSRGGDSPQCHAPSWQQWARLPRGRGVGERRGAQPAGGRDVARCSAQPRAEWLGHPGADRTDLWMRVGGQEESQTPWRKEEPSKGPDFPCE